MYPQVSFAQNLLTVGSGNQELKNYKQKLKNKNLCNKLFKLKGGESTPAKISGVLQLGQGETKSCERPILN